MKPQSNVKANGLANEIRWNQAEREAILTGRLGHGDVSGWAKGVSRPFGSVFKPVRPEVGKVARVSNPVRKLSDVHPIIAKPSKSDPIQDAILLGQHITDNGALIMQHRQERIVPITERFARHYKATVQRVGKEIKEQVAELEAIAPDALKAWMDERKQVTIPRG
jgi:hypothetical protein